MSAAWTGTAPHEARPEDRAEPRDEVFHRARAVPSGGGATLAMIVVNLSPGGLMARCEAPLAVGDRVRVELPVAGARTIEVRWALGGRIGCRFDVPIAARDYPAALAAMR